MEEYHKPRQLDVSGAARGVWLVKVPKYLSQEWQKAPPSGEVGKLRISKSRFTGGKPEVVFSLSSQLAQADLSNVAKVPRDHKFVLTGIANQSLSVLAQLPSDRTVSLEGKVIQRAECRPMADASYMKLKRTHLETLNKPQREVVQIDKVVNNYKPVSVHMNNLDLDPRKKDDGKRVRDPKEKVMDVLFNAFEKHQYYNVKDLVRITKQPVTYLKEILKEICIYNMKAPHRNMWELKPEYRHYKSHEIDST